MRNRFDFCLSRHCHMTCWVWWEQFWGTVGYKEGPPWIIFFQTDAHSDLDQGNSEAMSTVFVVSKGSAWSSRLFGADGVYELAVARWSVLFSSTDRVVV